jgi:hypothetical protein
VSTLDITAKLEAELNEVKNFRRHESRAAKTSASSNPVWHLKPNLRQHSLRLLSLPPRHLLRPAR